MPTKSQRSLRMAGWILYGQGAMPVLKMLNLLQTSFSEETVSSLEIKLSGHQQVPLKGDTMV